MSAGFKEVYDQFLGYSHQERVNWAIGCSDEVFEYLEKQGVEKDQIGAFFVVLVGLFIGVDGKITPSEAQMFNEIFGSNHNPGDLVDLVSNVTTNEHFNAVNSIIDGMPDEMKAKACAVALVIIASDGEITEDEANVFEELWR